MTDGVRPVGPVSPRTVRPDDRREDDRRQRDRRAERRMLTPVEEPAADAVPPPKPQVDPAGSAAFAVQMMGQGGQKRGLKGGQPVLDTARSAYLGAEYSGAGERRPKAGKVEDTDV